jgi:hypothetical protein
MGCSPGSKFTCILSTSSTGFPEILPRHERPLSDKRDEISHDDGDSPNHRLQRVMA